MLPWLQQLINQQHIQKQKLIQPWMYKLIKQQHIQKNTSDSALVAKTANQSTAYTTAEVYLFDAKANQATTYTNNGC